MKARGTGRTLKLIAASAMLAAAIAPAGAHAGTGDVYVADFNALGPPGDGAVLRVPAAGGAPAAFSGPSALFQQPTGLALDSDGRLLLADYDSAISAIYRIAPNGGISAVKSGAPLTQPSDVARDPDGSYVVTDFGATDEVFRVNRTTGAVTNIHVGAPLAAPTSVVVAQDRTIFIGDETTNDVYRIAPGTTTPVILSNAPLLSDIEDLELSPDGRTLYVANGVTGLVFKVDAATGATSQFAQIPGGDAHGLGLLPSGELLVSDQTAPRIVKVGVTGSPVTTFSSGAPYEEPHDLVVEPAKCGGKTPTIVGTNGKDGIRGSEFADVISTLGGNDTVKALGGKDLICGGGKNDKLFGGTGTDKLLGQAGKDTLKGGKGRDVCKGGKAADVGSSCEKGKV
jgi:sugar lactone lactonase YvrE